jgi:hypothetical protein
VPTIIAAAGENTSRRFIEFFAATIRNKNTRVAYAFAVGRFLRWGEQRKLSLDRIDSLVVATYIEMLAVNRSAPTVKQHLAGIRMCMDWLVSGGTLAVNPAWSVRGPKHVVKKGKSQHTNRSERPSCTTEQVMNCHLTRLKKFQSENSRFPCHSKLWLEAPTSSCYFRGGLTLFSALSFFVRRMGTRPIARALTNAPFIHKTSVRS